jgi:large subunit ribosomal protein L22e
LKKKVKAVTKKTAQPANKKAGVKKGLKKKKLTLKFNIDCTHPVEDGILDMVSFVS